MYVDLDLIPSINQSLQVIIKHPGVLMEIIVLCFFYIGSSILASCMASSNAIPYGASIKVV